VDCQAEGPRGALYADPLKPPEQIKGKAFMAAGISRVKLQLGIHVLCKQRILLAEEKDREEKQEDDHCSFHTLLCYLPVCFEKTMLSLLILFILDSRSS
jgi:hypothetical protein